MSALSNIRIVLVGTTHPGNIGAAARAMKTMGLTDLALVEPKRFPSADATARAAGANDILYDCPVFDRLEDAVKDCTTVIGTSARLRAIPIPIDVPRASAEWVASRGSDEQIAVVFGRERTGLTNEELDSCHRLVTISTSDDYHSLNLAAAVQVICHELRTAILNPAFEPVVEAPPATREEMEHYYRRLEAALLATGFISTGHPAVLMRRVRRLFGRAQPDQKELNILQGILTSLSRGPRPDDGATDDANETQASGRQTEADPADADHGDAARGDAD